MTGLLVSINNVQMFKVTSPAGNLVLLNTTYISPVVDNEPMMDEGASGKAKRGPGRKETKVNIKVFHSFKFWCELKSSSHSSGHL